MKFLIFSLIPLLFNARPISPSDAQQYVAQQNSSSAASMGLNKRAFSFSSWMRYLFPSDSATSDALDNALSQDHPQTHRPATGDGDYTAERVRLPPAVQSQIFNLLEVSFNEAKMIASGIGAPTDWAYRYHNPFLDDYSLLKKWAAMEDGNAKNKIKQKMMLNPTLQRILEWKGGLASTDENLENAIKEGYLDIVMYLIKNGVAPDQAAFNLAVKSGKLDMIKYLIGEAGFIPTQVTLNEAIRSQNLQFIKYLVEERGIFPVFQNFNEAILQRNPQLLAYFDDLAHHDKAYLGYYGSPSA